MKKMLRNLVVMLVIMSQCLSVMAADGPSSVIGAGSGNTYAVKKDGSLWAYGNTEFGQIGITTTAESVLNPVKVMDGVKSVVNGTATTFAIKQDNSLWGWGRNLGNYGNDGSKNSDVPVKLMENVKMVASSEWYTLVIKMDGSLWGTGQVPGMIPGLDGTTVYIFKPILPGETFKFVSANSAYVMVIKENDELWGWGLNNYGAMGIGNLENVLVPVKIMDSVAFVSSETTSSMIVKLDGSLWMAGAGYNGKFYDGSKVVENNKVVGYVMKPLKIMDNVLYTATTGTRWWVIKRDNTLWGWGSDGQFGLLDDYTKNEMIPTKVLDQVAYIVAGSRHIVVLKKDQTLWTAGQNAKGGIAGHEAGYKNYGFQQDLTNILDAPASWAIQEVNEAIEKGLVPAELQNDYTKPITRQEFAKLVVTMVEKKSGKTIQEYISSKGLTLPSASPFTDVNDSYVTAAFTLNIVSGIGNNLYDPNKTINRQEAAKMLTSTATALGYATQAPAPVFADSSQISSWAQPYIGYMVNIGVMKGSSNKFDPKGTYVRQMAFMTMNRIFENLN